MATKKSSANSAGKAAVKSPVKRFRAPVNRREGGAVWDKLSYTHRREHVEHVEEAGKPETRRRRIERSIALLAAGKKEPR